MRRAIVTLALLLGGTVLAQESPSFKMTEYTFNLGAPLEGTDLTSASFRITLGTINQGIISATLASPSFNMAGGFLALFPPPGEVVNLGFTDATNIAWDPEPSVGDYNLYLGMITVPFDPNYGACESPAITEPTTTVTATPGPGEALFIFATARNRLGEEGTKGFSSAGTARDNSFPCP